MGRVEGYGVDADRAAIALANTTGLVRNPVGGHVEVPCVSRIALHAVDAFASVSRMLPSELRETGEGGIADPPTRRRIALRMGNGRVED